MTASNSSGIPNVPDATTTTPDAPTNATEAPDAPTNATEAPDAPTNATEALAVGISPAARAPSPPPPTFCPIVHAVDTLDDLIEVGMLYEAPDYREKRYSVNVEGLHRMIPALREFQEMIGMEAIKRQVVDQVVYLSGKGNHAQFSKANASSQGPPAGAARLAVQPMLSAGRRDESTSPPPSPSVRAHSSTTSASPAPPIFRPASTLVDRVARDGCTQTPPNPSSSGVGLLSQLFGGLVDKRKATSASGNHFRMSESVTHDDTAYDMFHTVIYGPPGVGKTAFAKVLARIFLNLGITQNDTFRVARRSDLIGEYVGHTATKTQKVIDEAMGGVLFIDEVYALGSSGAKLHGESKSDSFSMECINTLNQNLTEHKGKIICIIAGYKKETEKHFFGLNPGLRRRFSFYYTIDAYDWEELTKILLFKIDRLPSWRAESTLATALLDSHAFLRTRATDFPHFAGDVETWLLNIKIAHCKRVFGKEEAVQRVVTYADAVAGYERFVAQKRGDENESQRIREELARTIYM